ncbi:CoA transferase [Micromonospora sp. RTGN7]|uniref:CaiB/BaiF CoA transferase family protein n=1 Tax=Micromonospora sp. RTGN7 TaxID=3016526 RepID=UPI0029FF13C1|nr:CoA transferase [Micromonospora sp. RTGN7]
MRVLEFAHLIAGPAAGLALADLGADVLKIERPGTGDVARGLGAMYRAWNGGKRSLTIDLHDDRERAVVVDLAAQADVVIESFRPGVMDRLGLGYDDIRAVNPAVIYMSVSGFGEHERLRDRAGVDAVIQAESGIMAQTGEPGGKPMRAGIQMIDSTTGLAAGQAVLAALYARTRHGRGDRISLSLFEIAVYMQSHQFTELSLTGREPERTGNSVTYAYPVGLFETADGAVMISCYMPGHWERLCEILHLDIDPRFASNADRLALRDELEPLIETAFRARPTAEVLATMLDAGLTAARVASYAEVAGGEAARLNQTFVDVGDHSVVRLPYHFAANPTITRTPAPQLGADNASVLPDL